VAYIRPIVFALLSAAIYTYILYSVSRSQDLFRGFGGDLPLGTRWLFDYYYVIYLLLAGSIVLVGALIHSKVTDNNPRLLFLGFISAWDFGISIACTFLATILIYLPVFQLGSAV